MTTTIVGNVLHVGVSIVAGVITLEAARYAVSDVGLNALTQDVAAWLMTAWMVWVVSDPLASVPRVTL